MTELSWLDFVPFYSVNIFSVWSLPGSVLGTGDPVEWMTGRIRFMGL